VLSNLGDVLAARGLLDDALSCYEAAIALDPSGKSCAEAHLGMGLTHWRGGRFMEAEASYRAALKVDPHNVDAHHYLGDTLRDSASQPVGSAPSSRSETRDKRGIRTRMEEAVVEYQAALKLKPDSVEVLDGLGQALLKLAHRRCS